MYGYNPKCFCKSQLHSTIINAYMSVEFSRNAFAKGLLQIFSCVTCEVRDDLQAASLTAQPYHQLLKLCLHNDVNLGHKQSKPVCT